MKSVGVRCRVGPESVSVGSCPAPNIVSAGGQGARAASQTLTSLGWRPSLGGGEENEQRRGPSVPQPGQDARRVGGCQCTCSGAWAVGQRTLQMGPERTGSGLGLLGAPGNSLSWNGLDVQEVQPHGELGQAQCLAHLGRAVLQACSPECS